MRRGLLFIVSAPSGTGKTTLVAQLVKTVPDLVVSRSYTSRPPRPGEARGMHFGLGGLGWLAEGWVFTARRLRLVLFLLVVVLSFGVAEA